MLTLKIVQGDVNIIKPCFQFILHHFILTCFNKKVERCEVFIFSIPGYRIQLSIMIMPYFCTPLYHSENEFLKGESKIKIITNAILVDPAEDLQFVELFAVRFRLLQDAFLSFGAVVRIVEAI